MGMYGDEINFSRTPGIQFLNLLLWSTTPLWPLSFAIISVRPPVKPSWVTGLWLHTTVGHHYSQMCRDLRDRVRGYPVHVGTGDSWRHRCLSPTVSFTCPTYSFYSPRVCSPIKRHHCELLDLYTFRCIFPGFLCSLFGICLTLNFPLDKDI